MVEGERREMWAELRPDGQELIVHVPIRIIFGGLPVGEKAKAGLTPKQRQVLDLILNGKCNKEIAAELGVEVRTAKFHASSIYARLGVEGRSGLMNMLQASAFKGKEGEDA